jgi:hypothetical protein
MQDIDFEPNDPKLYPNFKDHLRYVPSNYETLVKKYKGGIRKSVEKIVL